MKCKDVVVGISGIAVMLAGCTNVEETSSSSDEVCVLATHLKSGQAVYDNCGTKADILGAYLQDLSFEFTVNGEPTTDPGRILGGKTFQLPVGDASLDGTVTPHQGKVIIGQGDDDKGPLAVYNLEKEFEPEVLKISLRSLGVYDVSVEGDLTDDELARVYGSIIALTAASEKGPFNLPAAQDPDQAGPVALYLFNLAVGSVVGYYFGQAVDGASMACDPDACQAHCDSVCDASGNTWCAGQTCNDACTEKRCFFGSTGLCWDQDDNDVCGSWDFFSGTCDYCKCDCTREMQCVCADTGCYCPDDECVDEGDVTSDCCEPVEEWDES